MLRSPPMHAVYSPRPMSPFYEVDDDDCDSVSMLSGSFSRFAPSVASSATSHDWEMRSASPAPSVFSVTNSMRAAAYTLEYGRGLNNYSEIYRLPADDEEFERLDQQHVLFAQLMGKYPPPMPEVLADDTPGEVKTCLDIGCGSGSWILDVARDFPHCSTVAVDLVPMQVLNMPPNCRSEVDDVNLGLQHFYGDFNVVHARLVSSGIRDYQGLVDQISQTLRPNGLIDLMEFDFRVYGADKKPMLHHNAPSWFARWVNHCHTAVLTRGGEPDAANHLHRWISEHDSFEDVVYRDLLIASAPFYTGNDPEALRQNHIAQVFREDILAFLKSARPLLLGTGLPEVVVDELEESARCELLEARTPTYILVEHVYARKRQ